MRLGVINHHGREPAGSELSLLSYLSFLPKDVEPTMFVFEEGAFTEMSRERYPTVVLPMSSRIAGSTRSSFGPRSIIDAVLFTRRLANALKANQIDVVLTNSVKAHFIGMLAARMQSLPCVVFLHDVLQGKARLLLKTLARYCSTGSIACSRLAADALALKQTAIVYSPIETERFLDLPAKSGARRKLGIPDDGLPVIGLIGRVARWKGQDRFIRIAAKTLQQQQAHFVIIGSPIFGCDPEYPEELQTLTEQLGIASSVHFIPWQKDLPTAYAALDIACNCSDQEPFGRTTVEAMASSLPVVCFNDAGACEVYTDGASGYKITVRDEDAFADALCRLVQDPALRAGFGSNARSEAQQLQAPRLAPLFVNAISIAAKQKHKG